MFNYFFTSGIIFYYNQQNNLIVINFFFDINKKEKICVINNSVVMDRHSETEAKQLHLRVKPKPLWLTYPTCLCVPVAFYEISGPPFLPQTKPALVHLLDHWGKVVGQLHVSTLGPAGILEIGFHCHCSLLPSQALCTLEWKTEVCSINLFLSKKFTLIPQRSAGKWPENFYQAVLKGYFSS